MTLQPQAHVQVEAVVMRLHRHGRRLTLPVLLLIALAAAAGFWAGALPEAWMNWAAGLGAAALALLLGVAPILAWLAGRVTITNRRVIVRRGLLVHRRTEVPITRVREVRSRRGPVQRLFGSGDVELLVGAEEPTVLRDLPGPDVVIDALQELIERNFAPSAQPYPYEGYAAQHGLSPFGHPDDSPPDDATTVLPRG